MEVFNSQFLSQFSKLDTIQVIQFLQLLMIAGLIWIKIRDQGLARKDQENQSNVFRSLMTSMASQQQSGNERENKLAVAIEHQATESGKIGQALLLINAKVERHGLSLDDTQKIINDQHKAAMARIDGVAAQLTNEINLVKTEMKQQSPKQDEILRRLDRVVGYVEGLQLKLRTSEVTTITTLEPAPAKGFSIEAEVKKESTENDKPI